MNYKYLNANPKGNLIGDCAIRSLSVAAELEYDTVKRALEIFRKLTRARYYYSSKNLHLYVQDALGAQKITFVEAMSAEQFCKRFPRGRYVLDMEGHWSCCIGGIIYDTWDCSQSQVNFAYRFSSDTGNAPLLDKQVLRYCCTSEQMENSLTRIRIYDGNGVFSERTVPTEMAQGYVRCLQDQNYQYIEL